MKTLSNFTSELRSRNIAKPNLFFVEIAAPSLIQGDQSSVSLWCDMAQTPQSTILTQDNHTEAGTRRKYAYDQDYTNLTLDFYIDQEYKIKNFFDKWKGLTNSRNRNFGYPKDYTVDKLKVYSIDQNNNSTNCYEYLNVFPKSINSVDLSYLNGNAIAKFSVDFVFEDVNAIHYLNGREVSALADEKILVPGSGANQIVKTMFPNAGYYDDINDAINNPIGNAVDVAKFLTYESMFNELINIRIPSHKY